jgi:hypothetical protein
VQRCALSLDCIYDGIDLAGTRPSTRAQPTASTGPVFGKVRYMSAGGLERKAKPKEYAENVKRLSEE